MRRDQYDPPLEQLQYQPSLQVWRRRNETRCEACQKAVAIEYRPDPVRGWRKSRSLCSPCAEACDRKAELSQPRVREVWIRRGI